MSKAKKVQVVSLNLFRNVVRWNIDVGFYRFIKHFIIEKNLRIQSIPTSRDWTLDSFLSMVHPPYSVFIKVETSSPTYVVPIILQSTSKIV